MSVRQGAKEGIMSGMTWSYAERLISQAVTLLVSIILARLLVPEDYGIIAMVSVFITIGDALVNGGFGNALVHKKDATELDFNSICLLGFGVSAVIYFVLFISAPLISAWYETPVLVPVVRVMGLKFIFSAWNSVQYAYIQKKMIFSRLFWSSFIATVVSAIVGIIMAFSGFGVWALITQNLSFSIVSSFVMFFTIGWKPKLQFSFQSVKELWSFGAKVLGATLVFTLRDNLRTLIIGKRFSADDLAYYNEGLKFPSLLVVDIVNSMGKVIYPVFVDKREDMNQFKLLMRRAISLSAYILTPMMVGLFMVSESFVSVVLTDKWLPCVPYLRIMCIVYVTRSISTIYQKALFSIGKSNLNLIHEVLTSTITVILLFVAVFAFDSVLLIAWSAVAVMVLGLGFYAIMVRRLFGYSFVEMIYDYLPATALSVLMAVFVYLTGALIENNVLKLIMQIIIGVAVYIILSIATKNKEFKYVKNKVMHILKR